jgi:branched-chain amino acid transport system permease protein
VPSPTGGEGAATGAALAEIVHDATTPAAMLSSVVLVPAILNGLLTGAVYALVALGLTLIYGVLHIINFAHGALLTAAMFAAYFAFQVLGIDPYLSIFLIAPLFFAIG